MNAEQLAAQYLTDGQIVMPELADVLRQPPVRQQLYKVLLRKPRQPFHGLIRHLFQEEAEFRRALWDGDIEDDDDYYEGIYRCAFLLYGCGDASDTLVLWKAKHINMDVGCFIGAEYFVGAGLLETLAFLEHRGDKEAIDIREYVNGCFTDQQTLQPQKSWEEEREENILRA